MAPNTPDTPIPDKAVVAAASQLRRVMALLEHEHPSAVYTPEGFEIWLRGVATQLLTAADPSRAAAEEVVRAAKRRHRKIFRTGHKWACDCGILDCGVLESLANYDRACSE